MNRDFLVSLLRKNEIIASSAKELDSSHVIADAYLSKVCGGAGDSVGPYSYFARVTGPDGSFSSTFAKGTPPGDL